MQRLVSLRILWVTILSSSLLLFSAVLFVASPVALESAFVAPFSKLAIAAGIGSLVVPRALHGAALNRFTVASREAHGPPGTPPRRIAARPDEAFDAAFAAFRSPYIVSLALSKSVALAGFLAGVLGAPLTMVAAFFVTGWVLIAAQFPTLERIVGPAERASGVHIPRPPT